MILKSFGAEFPHPRIKGHKAWALVYDAHEVDELLRKLESEVSCRVWHGAKPKQVMEAFDLILRPKEDKHGKED